ncbi:DUF4142 domain-containing protein [Lysobacter sp. D1-1-M9]|uniref:DUF4142 domain-containing protein n=1 Tax=Novilysobacter longmucuonensis TaxID=3098603 RepID=UPI002FC72A09
MIHKTLTIWTASILAASVLAACAQDDIANDSAMVPPPGTEAADPAVTDGALTDTMAMDQSAVGSDQGAEALALVMAVDEHDIAAAEQARDKDVDGEVREFADMLHTEHTQNLETTRQLMQNTGGAVGDSAEASADPAVRGDVAGPQAGAMADVGNMPEVQAQRQKGEMVLRDLGAMEGDEYEQAYIDAMVQGHTDALAMLDERLQGVDDEQIRQHLTMTRDAIASHLERGQELQGKTQ